MAANPAYVITIPHLAQLAPEDAELKFMAMLLYFTPWQGEDGARLLKGEHATWAAAYEARFAELSADFNDNKSDKAFQTLGDMHRMETSTSETLKGEFMDAKKQQKLDVVTLVCHSFLLLFCHLTTY